MVNPAKDVFSSAEYKPCGEFTDIMFVDTRSRVGTSIDKIDDLTNEKAIGTNSPYIGKGFNRNPNTSHYEDCGLCYDFWCGWISKEHEDIF